MNFESLSSIMIQWKMFNKVFQNDISAWFLKKESQYEWQKEGMNE